MAVQAEPHAAQCGQMTWTFCGLAVESSGEVKGVHARLCEQSETASYHLNVLDDISGAAVPVGKVTTEGWKGIVSRQPHDYLCHRFPLLTTRWQIEMFSICKALPAAWRHISYFPFDTLKPPPRVSRPVRQAPSTGGDQNEPKIGGAAKVAAF